MSLLKVCDDICVCGGVCERRQNDFFLGQRPVKHKKWLTCEDECIAPAVVIVRLFTISHTSISCNDNLPQPVLHNSGPDRCVEFNF